MPSPERIAEFEALAQPRGKLFALAYTLLYDRNLCDDALQECLMRTWAALDEVKGPLLKFAVGVMYYVCYDVNKRYKRKQRQESRLSPHCDISSGKQNPEHQMIEDEKQGLAVRSIALLSERQQEVLNRFYVAGQTREQIEQEMGLTVGAFRCLKSHAKQQAALAYKVGASRQKLGRELSRIQKEYRRKTAA